MFSNTSRKLKVCSYIYFIGTSINVIYRKISLFIGLGCPSSMLIKMILEIINGVVLVLVISLFIYGFGKIVEYFEFKNDKSLLTYKDLR